METLEVSAKQFREKQGSFFDLADRGRQIVITRGVRQAYILMPVPQVRDDNLVLTPKLKEAIERARQQMREGKYTECKTYEDSLKHLETL